MFAKLSSLTDHPLASAFDHLRRDFETGCIAAASRSRKDLFQTLNQLFRRFRNYQTESDWVQTTLDAASAFAGQVAVFSLDDATVRLRGQMPAATLAPGLSFPLASAAAFATAVSLKDPVTALCTAGEVSPALSQTDVQRAHIFPILNGARVSAVLFVSDDAADMNALELICGIASSVLERTSNVALHSQIGMAPPPAPKAPEAKLAEAKLPAWGELPAEQRQLHIRAQRYARVTLAEIQLARPEACRAGRAQGDLYLFLKREIDKARENYRKQFMTVPSMVDYLHLELIQIAAEGDEEKLGVDYPGRLL